MPVPCIECKKNMSETAIVCPHCGARQADRDPRRAKEERKKPAPLSVSKDEAAALFQMRGADVIDLDEPRGPLALVLPRADATGWTRVAEWVLTLAAAPLLVPGFVLALFRLRFFGNHLMRASEGVLTLAVAIAGASGFWSVGALAGWSSSVIGGVVGVGLGALFTRLMLRRPRAVTSR